MKDFQHCLSIANETSPGIDSVTYSMIKHSHPSLQNVVLQTYNKIFTEKTFPETWRTAVIIPISKPNKDHTQLSTYLTDELPVQTVLDDDKCSFDVVSRKTCSRQSPPIWFPS